MDISNFKCGTIVEIIGPILFFAYSGLFKVGRNPICGDDWGISLTDLDQPEPMSGLGYYLEPNCLYIVPPDELPFKLIKYLDKYDS